MFFDTWADVGRTLLSGVLAYAAIVLFLRVTGKRTLSKWNAFDFIVTIALGSTLASTILSEEVSLAEGATALGLLVALQFVATWLSVRSATVRGLLKAEPTLLLYQGQFQRKAMRHERVAESEVRAAIRAKGISDLAQVAAVVLETDGSFSVITEFGDTTTTLDEVIGFDDAVNASMSA